MSLDIREWLKPLIGTVSGGAIGGLLSHFNPLWPLGNALPLGFAGKVWAELEGPIVEADFL